MTDERLHSEKKKVWAYSAKHECYMNMSTINHRCLCLFYSTWNGRNKSKQLLVFTWKHCVKLTKMCSPQWLYVLTKIVSAMATLNLILYEQNRRPQHNDFWANQNCMWFIWYSFALQTCKKYIPSVSGTLSDTGSLISIHPSGKSYHRWFRSLLLCLL